MWGLACPRVVLVAGSSLSSPGPKAGGDVCVMLGDVVMLRMSRVAAAGLFYRHSGEDQNMKGAV